MKKVFKKIYSGIAMGCFAFVAMIFIASVFAGGGNTFFASKTGDELLTLAACFIVISIGFYVPSLIYDNEKMALWLRTLTHMLIGTVVYLFTAYFAGWMKAGFGEALLYVLLALGIAALIWLCIFFSIKGQAKRINAKIKEKRQGA
ncbi:MAG: DUF3021 domain-containing protein [Bacillota bacterium]